MADIKEFGSFPIKVEGDDQPTVNQAATEHVALNVQGGGLKCNNLEPENNAVVDRLTPEDKVQREAARLDSAPSPYQADNPIPPPGSKMALGPIAEGAYAISPTFYTGNLEALEGWKDLGAHVPGATDALGSAYNALTAINEARQILAKDTGKTEAQRLAVLAASAGKRHDAVYAAIGASIQNIHKGIETYEADLNKSYEVKGATPLAAEMRALFRSKSVSEKEKVIRTAIEDGNQLVLSSVLGVPPALTEIHPELHKILLRQLNEKQSPDTMRRIALMKKAAGVLGRAQAALTGEFERCMRGSFATATKTDALSNESAIALAKVRGERLVG